MSRGKLSHALSFGIFEGYSLNSTGYEMTHDVWKCDIVPD